MVLDKLKIVLLKFRNKKVTAEQIEEIQGKIDAYIETKGEEQNEDENIDIDFLYNGKNIELKTSLIPDVDVTIEKAIANRDIKLIKRGNHIEELRGDIHLQIFFNQRRKAKDEWLAGKQIDIETASIDDLFNTLLAKCYRDTTYFIGWVDKAFITKKINLKKL